MRAGFAAVALWLLPVAAIVLLARGSVFADIATYFAKLAVLTFGAAYAVLAWVAQEAVGTYGWLQPGEMLDGLGMAETTPGPLIMVLQFVGFTRDTHRTVQSLRRLLRRQCSQLARMRRIWRCAAMPFGNAWYGGCVKPLKEKAAFLPRKTPLVSERRKSLILRR